MKIRHLLVAAAVSTAVASASAFEWTPVITSPYAGADLTYYDGLGIVSFNCTGVDGDVTSTEIMPKWIDEDGNEIVAVSCVQDPWGWDPTAFQYTFNKSDFKANGEYILLFPEGMLENAAKEKSAKKENYYTFAIPELEPPMFEDFKVLSITPDLSKPQGYWDNQVLTINTNHNDAIGVVGITVTDNNALNPMEAMLINSLSFSSGRKLGDASEVSFTIEGKWKFLQGHTYTAEIILYNGEDTNTDEGPTKIVSKLTYEFTGTVEGYKYSDLKLVSIDPEPYSVIITDPAQAVFTYTFSGPVNITKVLTPQGQNGNNVYPQTCLSSNDDKTVWTINLSDDAFVKSLSAELLLHVYAQDLNGYQLRGDLGEEEGSCFTASWECDLGGKSIVVLSPKDGETVETLTEIVVASVNGEEMSYNWATMAIQDLLGNTIGTLVCETEGKAKEFHFTKWIEGDSWDSTPLSDLKSGSYVIYFPIACFQFGEEFAAVNSRSLYSGFQVGSGENPDDPGVDPAEQETFKYNKVDPENDSTVKSLDTIKIWFPEMVACNEFNVEVFDASNNSVVSGTGTYDWDDVNLIVVTLSKPVTEAGKYEVVIPARAIGNDEFMTSDGKAGLCNPEIRLSYTVDPNANGVDAISNASLSNVYDMQGRVVLTDASSDAIKTLEKGIYIVGGKKVVVK